ncbi:hypothetical protein [Microcoleus sp. S13C4]
MLIGKAKESSTHDLISPIVKDMLETCGIRHKHGHGHEHKKRYVPFRD